MKLLMRRLSVGMAAAIAAAGLLTGCAAPKPADTGKLSVFATTGYLADAVNHIAPEASVTTLIGPGGDPHTYQPTTQDIEMMQSADLTVWNGLHLEAHMTEQLEALGDKQFAAEDVLAERDLLGWDDENEPTATHDPHVWNSPENWQKVVMGVGEKFAEIDPANADTYRKNAATYRDEIGAAHADIAQMMATIPDDQRTLVTGHDAFEYFGHTYNLDVEATDLVSTEAELSAGEIRELADFIATHKVKTIFQDNQKNPQAITSLKEAVHAKGWEVQVSDEELYADSLGADSDVDTYLEVLMHNARVVTEGLGGKVPASTESAASAAHDAAPAVTATAGNSPAK
ncbi:metal ABC transporter substrate-binding protein [Gulosibacter bifidus]|uniref:Metal ABC transporter substrate-binding protein n=2 Tax=Gulosibacter bifidus TaxID=272239 RepID=A0ABW5RM87_9MICO